jgi:hypothetical protein
MLRQAVVETKRDGTVAIALDDEAARAMIASIVFTSRFHEESCRSQEYCRRVCLKCKLNKRGEADATDLRGTRTEVEGAGGL